jgi:hypothetical protein
MPIRMLNDDETGLIYPMIECDVCSQRIENARDGAVWWDMLGEPPGPLKDLQFAHRGQCSMQLDRPHLGDISLESFLLYLNGNLGYDHESASRSAEVYSL